MTLSTLLTNQTKPNDIYSLVSIFHKIIICPVIKYVFFFLFSFFHLKLSMFISPPSYRPQQVKTTTINAEIRECTFDCVANTQFKNILGRASPTRKSSQAPFWSSKMPRSWQKAHLITLPQFRRPLVKNLCRGLNIADASRIFELSETNAEWTPEILRHFKTIRSYHCFHLARVRGKRNEKSTEAHVGGGEREWK